MKIENLSYRPCRDGQKEAVMADLVLDDGGLILPCIFRTEYLLYGMCPCIGRDYTYQGIRLGDKERLRMLEFIRGSREKLYGAYPVKTYALWQESGLPCLEDFCKPGDVVDERMADCFAGGGSGIIRHDYVQDGEIFGFTEVPGTGRHIPTYHTFYKKDGEWVYTGVCIRDGKDCIKGPVSCLDICIAMLKR